MADYLSNGVILPEMFEVPESLVYQYMIWSLAKYYRIAPMNASMMSEIDFWQMAAFENLEQSKTEYLLKLRSES